MTVLTVDKTLETDLWVQFLESPCYLFGSDGKFCNQSLLNSSTVLSSETGQFCFWYSYCTIFKIIDTLILNANMANIKTLFGPENLLELSRNVPLVTQAKLTSKQPYFHARNQFILETWSFRVSWQKIHLLQRSVLELPTMKQNKYNALTVWKSSGSRKRRNWKTSGTKKGSEKRPVSRNQVVKCRVR